MKILLECTDMGSLQRNADVLIGRAIELLAQPEQEQEPVAWMSLSDIEWMNIVNDQRILELTDGRHNSEEAVNLAVKMTEEKCKKNNSDSIPKREQEQHGTQYLLDQVSMLRAENAMLKEKWSTPKREPLSHEHLEALVDKYHGYPRTLVRTVESIHGIKTKGIF